MKMVYKWTPLLCFCIWLTNTKGVFCLTDNEIKIYIKENIEEFKAKLHQKMEQMSANHFLHKKRQSSKTQLYFRSCMESLENHLSYTQRKIDAIASKMKNVLLSSDTTKMSTLKVEGNVISRRLSSVRKFDVKFNVSSPVSLRKISERTKHRIKVVQSELSKTLFKSQPQLIKNKVILKNVTAVKGKIGRLSVHLTINQLATKRLTSTLRKRGNQLIWNRWIITNISCVKATVGSLNGNKMEDFIRLNQGSLTVGGSYTFQNVSAKTVFVKGRINELKFDDLFLTSQEQDIYNSASFERLSANNIQAYFFDENYFDELKKIEKYSVSYPSMLNFSSTLFIEGDLNIRLLNDNNVIEIFLKTVNTNREQNITGTKIFKRTLIKGNAVVAGKINNRTLDQFMTTSTNQSLYAHVQFPEIVVLQSIYTDSLNGIDLSLQAVIKSRNIIIRGKKTFTKDLKVSNIFLKEGVLIDSFDPSVEASKIILSNDAQNWNIYWRDNVTIGNINATDVEIDADYFPQLENLKNVWLRATEQDIPTFKAKKVNLNELEVSRVNGIPIEDIVKVKGNATIRSPVRFTGDVYTKTLKLKEKTNLNLSPEYWKRQKVKISNNITIEKALLKGNLIIDGSLRNFESGFMQVKDDQIINDRVQFEEVIVQDLSFKDLNLNIINNFNITDFLKSAVVAPIRNKSIHNKQFKALKGFDILFNGVLNNISLEKVVLKDRIQYLTASLVFLNPPSFKSINVNKFMDSMQFDNVILKNKHGLISNKKFNGKVTTTHAYSNGYVNGVNISYLQQVAFDKTKRNFAKERVIFHGNIKADGLQIAANKIDNINLKDAIRLDSPAYIRKLVASDVITQNITVTGLINRCNIKSIIENSFLLQEFKNIIARTYVKSLNIDGNLNIQYLVGQKFSDWISFLKLAASAEIERNLEFESLNIENVTFFGTLNNITVNFLMTDAVRKLQNQIVYGRKYFQEINSKTCFFQKLKSYETCGINVTNMFDLYVSKTENKTFILSNPCIKSLVGRQVSVGGNLNGLKFPTDVILSNVNEEITSEVIMNNATYSKMGLNVLGKINGKELEKFTKERVTLNATQNLFAALNFTKDVFLRGNTGFNKTINKLYLENVLKKLSNQIVSGNKYFSSDLEISADVVVNGAINEVYLENFLWQSRNEYVKEVQFSRLSASDLKCDTINGVHITELYNYTHDLVHYENEKLDALTSDILSVQDSLRSKRDSLENPLSLLSYFELHNVIKFGPVLKFLPVYEYGTIGERHELEVIQMVMWVSVKLSGCRKIMSHIADVSTNGTFTVTKKIRGKMFPFSLQVEKEDVVGFYVQAEYSRKCSPEIKNLIIKTIFSSNDINVSKISLPEGASLVDVQLLELRDIYLIVALNMKDPGERVFMYQYDAFNNSWYEHQQFHSENITSVEFILLEGDGNSFYEVYLSVTNDKKNSGIYIYEWDLDNDEFFLKTNLSTTASTHAMWVYAHHNLYLLLSKEMVELERNHTRIAVFSEPLEVYTLDEDELILNHIVNIKGIRFTDSFTLAGEIFILATSSHMEIVYVLQFRGYNGFEVIREIPAAGITEARVFTVDSQLYVTLNSRTVQSRILKASIHEGRLFVI